MTSRVEAAPASAGSDLRDPDLPIRVLKFGGTSVTGVERLAVLARVVESRLEHCRPILVVSAFAGVTDLLRRVAVADGGSDIGGSVVDDLRSLHRAALQAFAPEDVAAARDVDALLDEADQLVRGIGLVGECSPRTLDQVVSLGERLSSRIIAAGLTARGIAARAVDSSELIVTDAHFGNAAVDNTFALRVPALYRGKFLCLLECRKLGENFFQAGIACLF